MARTLTRPPARTESASAWAVTSGAISAGSSGPNAGAAATGRLYIGKLSGEVPW
jgi:hypothetical protein